MTNRRLRILYVAGQWPQEGSTGVQLRLLQVGRALQNVGEVNLVVADYGGGTEALEKTSSEFQVYSSVDVLDLPRNELRRRLKWWLTPRSLNIYSCIAEERGRIRVCNALSNFDLIWINSLRVANMFGLWCWPRSILDIDDIPSTYELTKWRNADRVMDRLKAGARLFPMRRDESFLRERFSVLGVCSEADRRYLGGGSRIHVIPNGFERPAVEPHRQPVTPPRLGFIGNFKHPPNFHGVQWFLRTCWDRINCKAPGARLRLVGQGSDSILEIASSDVDSLGWVMDPSEEIATWSAMIVPIRLGAGTRVKVAEAFSRKVPVVSTRLGAFGYDLTNGQEVLLADTPEAFVSACVQLIQAPVEAATMAERAWQLFLNKWTWNAIVPRVCEAAQQCLSLSRAAIAGAPFCEKRQPTLRNLFPHPD
jgi:glycosyltransferase involved in cell wall biosynthesis